MVNSITEETLEKIGFEKSEYDQYLYGDVECSYRYKTTDRRIYIVVFKVKGRWKCECGKFFGTEQTHPLIAENEIKVVVDSVEDIQRCIGLAKIEVKLNH